MSNTEAPDLDQAGQFRRWANPQLSGDCVEMDTVIAHQNGPRKLSGAPGDAPPAVLGARFTVRLPTL